MNIVTGVGDNNGAGPLLGSASVNVPQMGEKRRRAILPTKRDTAKKKSGVDSLLKSISLQEEIVDSRREGIPGKLRNFSVVQPLWRTASHFLRQIAISAFDYRLLQVAGQ